MNNCKKPIFSKDNVVFMLEALIEEMNRECEGLSIGRRYGYSDAIRHLEDFRDLFVEGKIYDE